MQTALSISRSGLAGFARWIQEAPQAIVRHPIEIGSCVLAAVLVLGTPATAGGGVFYWPLAYVLTLGFVCHRGLGSGASTRAPWGRLFLLGGVACLPLLGVGFLLAALGGVSGKGEFLLFIFMLLGISLVGWEWLLLLGTVAFAAASLALVVAILFAPAFVAVRGYGVGRALRTSLRCWRANPLAALGTLFTGMALLAGAHAVFALLLPYHPLVAWVTAYGYAIGSGVFAIGACVAASVNALDAVRDED